MDKKRTSAELTGIIKKERELRKIQAARFKKKEICKDRWNSDEKRLFSLCYWSVLRRALSNPGSPLNQRRLSLLITGSRQDGKKIKEDPNFIAKLIKRNTFPSDELASEIERNAPQCMLRKDNAISLFLKLPPEIRRKALLPFIRKQERRNSGIMKDIEKMIVSLDEYQLRELRGYLTHMTVSMS